MQVQVPPLDDLWREVQAKERSPLGPGFAGEEPRMPWSQTQIEDFVDYCVRVLESAPEDQRINVVSTWRRGVVKLTLRRGRVSAERVGSSMLSVRTSEDLEQGYIRKPDSFQQDELEAAGWRSARPFKGAATRYTAPDWFPPKHLKHPAFPL